MVRSRKWMAGLMGVVVTVGVVALARPVWVPDFREMTEKSDLVVIASPVARKELPDRTVMPGVMRGGVGNSNERIPAIQIETTFRVAVVFRGKLPADQEQFTFLHLMEANPPTGPVVNGQALVDFQPNSGNQYLMFLKRRDDGRYEAMNGQTDPAFSIRAIVAAGAAPTTKPQDSK